MKKKLAMLVAGTLAASMLLSGCSSNDASNDYVTVGGYKGIEVDDVKEPAEVTDDDVNNYIEAVRNQYATSEQITDRGVIAGDTVNIDFVGKMNGEAFDGGSSEGYDLKIGSGSFIDGFESGLVGHKAGETVTLDLTFPSDYEKTDLAGQPVTFTVKINKVSRPAEMTWDKLTDDYVADNFSSQYGLTTVKDFKDRVNDSMQSQLDVAVQKAYLEKLVEESEVTLPDGLLDKRIEKTMNSYETTCQQYGMTVDDYIQNYYGKTVDEYKESLKEDLTTSLKEELVLEALVGKLKVKVTADEFNSFVSYYAKYYRMTEDAFIEECGGKDYLVLNYAEYYQALVQAAKKAKVTYVDNSKTDSSSDDTSATAE